MADELSEEVTAEIQEAVKTEVDRLQRESIAAEIAAVERGIRVDTPNLRRYVIYWTAAQPISPQM